MVIPHVGPMELGIILLIVMMVFGVGKLPQVGGAMGKGIRAFRKGQSGEEDEAPPKPKRKITKKTAEAKTNQEVS